MFENIPAMDEQLPVKMVNSPRCCDRTSKDEQMHALPECGDTLTPLEAAK